VSDRRPGTGSGRPARTGSGRPARTGGGRPAATGGGRPAADARPGAGSTRLLVTEDAPAYGVLAALRALRAAGYEPWLAVARQDAYARRSRAAAGVVKVPDPARDRPGYVAALARAAAHLEVTAVLPGTDLALMALAGTHDAFPTGVRVATADPETVRLATDKRELERLAERTGLTTPPCIHTTYADVQAGLEVTLPAIVKPPSTRTPTDGGFATSFARRAATREELLAAVRAVPGEAVMIQPALNGDLTAVCGVAWQGRVAAITLQRAWRIYPPGCGITAFAETIPIEPALEAGVRRLMNELGWSGIFQAQFISTPQGSYMIDLNPRIYGSLALAVAAGLNLPAIWADLLTGREPRMGSYRVGVRFRSEERDLAALVSAAAKSDWRTVLGVLRPRRGTAHALASLRDPIPLFTGGRLARIRRICTRWLRAAHPRDAHTDAAI
jgi:predicted ATP-grasp superfamily ATP-dependent carboligase